MPEHPGCIPKTTEWMSIKFNVGAPTITGIEGIAT